MGTPVYVTAAPRRPLRDLLAQIGPMGSVLLSYDRLYTLGRDAIYWGLKSLEPKPGDCVWMPSFHCGVEVQAALDAGFEVDFYRIRRDLSIDEEDLEYKLDRRPGPIVIIHYFGFAQPGVSRVAELCYRQSSPLIEDCSHALFSSFMGKALGSFGHFAAFSLYKTLGLCDGGALSINRSRWQRTLGHVPAMPPRGRPGLYGYRLQLRALIKNALGPPVVRRFQAMRLKDRTLSNNPGAVIKHAEYRPRLRHRHDYRGGMSMLSRRLASTMDPAMILRRRTDNWRFLHERLSAFNGYSNMFHDLQKGACPLFFPIRVSQREMLVSRLGKQNIETFTFGRYAHPRMNKALYPEAAVLRRQILCLPMHQYMNELQLARLVEVAGPLLEEHAA
jgi:perosamine synthetase